MQSFESWYLIPSYSFIDCQDLGRATLIGTVSHLLIKFLSKTGQMIDKLLPRKCLNNNIYQATFSKWENNKWENFDENVSITFTLYGTFKNVIQLLVCSFFFYRLCCCCFGFFCWFFLVYQFSYLKLCIKRSRSRTKAIKFGGNKTLNFTYKTCNEQKKHSKKSSLHLSN